MRRSRRIARWSRSLEHRHQSRNCRAGALEKQTLFGHSDGIPGLAFSPDGRLLALTGKDQAVRRWDLATGRVVRKLRGFNGAPQREPKLRAKRAKDIL